MTAIRGAIAFALVLFAGDMLALEPLRIPPEMRRHYRVRARDGTVLYTITTIHRFSEQEVESIALVRDETFMDLIFRDVLSFEQQYALHRISDLKNEAYVQQSFDMAIGAKSWSETRALMFEHESIRNADVILKLETNGGVWEYPEADLKNDLRRRERRPAIRSSVSPSLLEALERMRGTLFGTSAGHEIYRAFAPDLFYDAASDPPASTEATLSDETPACEFDSSFGYPCTENQLARIERAAKEGKNLIGYW